MKFLVPNYSCLQNPWLGGYRPHIPVLSALCPQLNLLNPPGTKFLGTPLMTSHHDARCSSFTALIYHYCTTQHRPRGQDYIFPILATVSKSRRGRNSTIAFSTNHEQTFPLPRCGIGGLPSVRRFSEISSFAVSALRSLFDVHSRPMRPSWSISV